MGDVSKHRLSQVVVVVVLFVVCEATFSSHLKFEQIAYCELSALFGVECVALEFVWFRTCVRVHLR